MLVNPGRVGQIGRTRASGGTPTPPITLAAPTYYDAFDYADGTRLVAGDPNANAGQVATNPGNLGWTALTSGAADNSRFNLIVYQGKVTVRSTNAFGAASYILSPNVALSGWQTVKGVVVPISGQQTGFSMRATNQANRLTLRNNNTASIGIDQVIAGTTTTLATVAAGATARKAGGLNGNIRAFNDADETMSLITYQNGGNWKAIARRKGVPIGTADGYTFTDPAGSLFGFGVGSTFAARDVLSLQAQSAVPTVLILTETFNTWYPKVKAAAGDAITTGSARITFNFTYFGTAPTRIAWRLKDPITLAVVKAFAAVAIGDQTIGGGTGSITVDVPVGLNGRAAYAICIAPMDANFVVDEDAEVVSVKHFYVALNIALIGQSNSGGLTNTMTSGNYADYPGSATYQKADPPLPISGVTFNECTGYYASTTNQTGDKCTARIGDILSTQLNIPVCFEVIAIAATGAFNLGPAGANWSYILAHHANAGGAFEMLYLSQGEAEFTSGGSSWLAQWVDENLDAYMALSGQPAGTEIPLFLAWTGRNPGGATATLASTKAMREGQDGFIAYANSQITDLLALAGHHYVGCKMVDGLHPNAVLGEGYDEAGRRLALSVMKHLGASAYDGMGPIATTATRSGAVITIDFDLNGATSLTCRNGEDQSLSGTASALTSWEVSANDFASNLTISSAELVGNQVVLTLSADPGGPVKVRNHYGFQPTVTSWAFGAYADGSYIGSKPIITPLVSN